MILARRKYKRYDLGGPTLNLNGDVVDDPRASIKKPSTAPLTEGITIGKPQSSQIIQPQTAQAAAQSIGGSFGQQAGIWGALSQVGESIGTKTRGNNENLDNNYIGNWQTPTHLNVIDAVNHGDTNEILDNVFFGGLFGTKGKRQKEEAILARHKKQDATMDYYSKQGEAKLLGYDSTGNSDASSFYASGGEIQNQRLLGSKEIGGNLKPLNSDTVEVEGRTHEEGGVKIPDIGAELEDRETVAGNYVFSDFLGFADRHKKIATQIGKIEKKPLNDTTKTSLFLLRGKEQRLKEEQEELKQQLGLLTGKKMKTGGPLIFQNPDGGHPYPNIPEDRQWYEDGRLFIDDNGNLKERLPSQMPNLSSQERKNLQTTEFNNTYGFQKDFKRFNDALPVPMRKPFPQIPQSQRLLL